MKNMTNFKRMRSINHDPQTTSWIVSGLGLAVSALGTSMVNKKVGAGILGFGLAHVILGQLDRLRPTVRHH